MTKHQLHGLFKFTVISAYLAIGIGGCTAGIAGTVHGIWNNAPFWQVAGAGFMSGSGLTVLALGGWMVAKCNQAAVQKAKSTASASTTPEGPA